MSQAIVLREAAFESAALSLIEAKRSTHTRAAYKADLERWMRFCMGRDVNPGLATLPDATTFRERALQATSPASVRRLMASLSAIYGLLFRSGIARSNPFHPAILAWPPSDPVGRTPLVADEVAEAMIANAQASIAAYNGARDVAVLRLLYDTGLRRESVATIKRADLRGKTLFVTVKGRRPADVTLPEETREAIHVWLTFAEDSVWLFPGRKGQPIHPVTVSRIVALRSAAIGAHVSPHCFRAAFITAGYDLGIAETELQGAVHHKDPKTTRRYDRKARGANVPETIAAARKRARSRT